MIGPIIATTSVSRLVAGSRSAAHPLNAPRTSLNAPLTPNRSVAFGSAPLEQLREVRHRFDVTINDVMLAACTAGLRRYLDIHGGLPDRPLVCSVPVSTHDASDSDSANQVAAMFVHLPVHLDDPLEQLRAIHQGGEDAKEVQHSVGPDIIGDMIEMIPGSLFQMATDLYSSAQLADRMAPVHNLIVSNVMGPPMQLYFAGARVSAIYPLGPLMEGSGLNISVVSNNGEMNIGLIACPELVTDVEDLLDGILAGLDSLSALPPPPQD